MPKLSFRRTMDLLTKKSWDLEEGDWTELLDIEDGNRVKVFDDYRGDEDILLLISDTYDTAAPHQGAHPLYFQTLSKENFGGAHYQHGEDGMYGGRGVLTIHFKNTTDQSPWNYLEVTFG